MGAGGAGAGAGAPGEWESGDEGRPPGAHHRRQERAVCQQGTSHGSALGLKMHSARSVRGLESLMKP